MTTLCPPLSLLQSLLFLRGVDVDVGRRRSELLWYFIGLLNFKSGFGAKSYELLAFFILLTHSLSIWIHFNSRFNPSGWSFRFTFMLMG